jgi:RimJ/RimL family protein N-acetyltransferase
MDATQLKNGDIVLRGNRVILRPVIENDLATFCNWLNDPEILKFLNKEGPLSYDDEVQWFERSKNDPDNRVDFAVVDSINDRLIGSMGIHHMKNTNRTAYTGTIIGEKEYWCKGYATEAKMVLLDYAFNIHLLPDGRHIRKIYSDIKSYNPRSMAYAAKCGYVEESRLPKHFEEKNGELHDRVFMAVYREPWLELWEDYRKKYNL